MICTVKRCTVTRLTLLVLLSAGSFQAAAWAEPLVAESTPAPLKASVAGEWVKTELYCSEYQGNVVEPVFAKGFTVHDIYGQFQHSTGTIQRGQTRVLIIVSRRTAELAKDVSLILKAYHQQFPGVKTMSISMPVEDANFMGI